MSDTQKKMAAALAAVSAYLQEEQALAAPAPTAAAAGSPPGVLPSLWGQYGRQEMMTMRRLVQLRAFDRFR